MKTIAHVLRLDSLNQEVVTDGVHSMKIMSSSHSLLRSFRRSSLAVMCAAIAALVVVSLQAQDLYVGSSPGIYKITPGGSPSLFAPEAAVYSLAFDSAGNLFAGDGLSPGYIFKYTPSGVQSTFATGVVNPFAIAFNSSGTLFAASAGDFGTIYQFTPGGVKSPFATSLVEPDALAFDAQGNLFAADFFTGKVYKYTRGGSRSTFASGLVNPSALAFDRQGNLFGADLYTGNIYKYGVGGGRTTFASGLNHPSALAFDVAGDLFVGEFNSGNIFEYAPDGSSRSIFATGFIGITSLAFPGLLPVPEPSVLGIFVAGAVAAVFIRRRSFASAH